MHTWRGAVRRHTMFWLCLPLKEQTFLCLPITCTCTIRSTGNCAMTSLSRNVRNHTCVLSQDSNQPVITKTRLFKYIEHFITKSWKFSYKNSNIFHIAAPNIDCGYSLEPPRRGGSNEYPQSMFLSRNKKNDVYPCKPQFYYIKLGFKGVKII